MCINTIEPFGLKARCSGPIRMASINTAFEGRRRCRGLLWEHWLCEGQKQLIRDLFAEEGEEKGKDWCSFGCYS